MAIFITSITILAALFAFFGAAGDFWSMVSNIPFFQRRKFNEEEKQRLANYLRADSYYQHLSAEGKNKFMNRLIRFMINKDFEGKAGLTVTEEMEVEISASAIRLTFGLDEFILPTFDTIWIFPETFVFGLDRLKMKGGTTPNGRVMLSWKDFLSGNADASDRINLGLHEFAHALKIELADGDEFDQRFSGFYPEWEKEGTVEMMRMRSKKSSVLREYASANINEFFAVAAEHFFERPAELKSLLPELYEHYVWLLNQDPLNVQNDYSSTSAIKIISPVENLEVKDKWHWSLNILLSGIFIGIPSLIYFASQNIISTTDIFLFIVFFGSVNIFSWNYFRERRVLSKFQFTLYSLLGVGIWSTSLMLLLNCQLPIGKTTSETLIISKAERGISGDDKLVRVNFENGEYENDPLFRTFYFAPNLRIWPSSVTLNVQRGIFGIKTAKSFEIR